MQTIDISGEMSPPLMRRGRQATEMAALASAFIPSWPSSFTAAMISSSDAETAAPCDARIAPRALSLAVVSQIERATLSAGGSSTTAEDPACSEICKEFAPMGWQAIILGVFLHHPHARTSSKPFHAPYSPLPRAQG